MLNLTLVYKYSNMLSMTSQKENKIHKLLKNHEAGTVMLSSSLSKLGISRNLQYHYREAGILKSIGQGAFVLPNEKFDIFGAVYTLQEQLKFPLHIGALSSLALQGSAHYIRPGKEKIYLFLDRNKKLPSWFVKYNWNYQIFSKCLSLFITDKGFIHYSNKYFVFKISAPERAILELLYLVPNDFDMMEAYNIMEGLLNLRPKLMQELLENCNSFKVKRLFLFMANKIRHKWFKFLDLNKIDLGIGNRTIAKNGAYDSKYKITVNKGLL